MANIVKNINSILSQAIHGPKVDGMPLYTRIDSEFDETIGKNKTLQWEKASIDSYCSPTNVKRVLIAGDMIVVNTFKPVIKNGKPASYGCWRDVYLGTDDLFKTINSMISYNEKLKRGEKPDNVRMTGTGLNVIHRPWACTNIEELYFDFSILLSEDYMSDNKIATIMNKYLAGARGKLDSSFVLHIASIAFKCDVETIKRTFPRLRCICLISELSWILNEEYSRGKTNVDSLEDSIINWYRLGDNFELIKDSNSMISIAEFGNKKYNTSFEVRDGIYKFDEEYLRPYVDSYKDKVKALEQKETEERIKNIQQERGLLKDKEPEKSKTEEEPKNVTSSSEYNEEIHGMYRQRVEDMLLSTWRSMYKNHVDGTDVINGLVIPSGVLSEDSSDMRYSGMLCLTKGKLTVKPNVMSNPIWEEFIGACKDVGIPLINKCSVDSGKVEPYRYNPVLQKIIASGEINQTAFTKGWSAYEKALKPFIVEKSKEIAIEKVKTGSDQYLYQEFSGYTTALAYIDYKDGLGTKLKVCCGDTSKTEAVAKRLVKRLEDREKSHFSIGGGQMVITKPSISSDKKTFVLDIYLDMKGYQAIPKFMGELLVNLDVGQFKPSLDNMIIGVDLENNIVTAPFTKWLLPIIAGSRSGKGVLTLSMLLNVIGIGAPLFYLDGKPDMATLLWNLQKKHGIAHSMVFDGIGHSGITPIDKKHYKAPYSDIADQALRCDNNFDVMEDNQTLLIYLKAMQVILLSNKYYREEMGSCYGNIFMVMDEVYAVLTKKMEIFINQIDREFSKCDRSNKERKGNLMLLRGWAGDLLSDYMAEDVGIFGNGIKAVALTQFAQSTQYAVHGFQETNKFCTNFLLKRAVKLFGRQEGGAGIYGVEREHGDETTHSLYQEFFHFGIGGEQNNTYKNIKTFKPLLVLNENDCKELTGANEDGAFTADMVSRVSKYTNIEDFRDKYFRQNRELADAIGFEGALNQIARLAGTNAEEMLRVSLERAYEIADKAMRFYGVIDDIHIKNVYEYICSCRIDYLWNCGFISKSKKKGISLYRNDGVSNTSENDSNIFGSTPENSGVEFDFGDEASDSGIEFDDGLEINGENERDIATSIKSNINTLNDKVNKFGTRVNSLRDEDELILKQIKEKREINKLGKNTFNFDTDDSEIITEDGVSSVEEIKEQKAKPFISKHYGEEAFNGGTINDKIFINPNECKKAIEFNDENSIKMDLNNSMNNRSKFEEIYYKSSWGTNYEFNKRWNAVLNSIKHKINRDLVTRIMLLQDEMVVNGRYVCLNGIIGGYENIRLEDIVNFKMLFKTFNNISEIVLDEIILEKADIEMSDIPQDFFRQTRLNTVTLIRADGTKEVITRSNMNRAKTIEEERYAKEFEKICANRNPRLNEKSAGYKNKVWGTTKKVGKKGLSRAKNEIFTTKGNPVKGVFIGALTVAAIAGGSVASLANGMFSFIKNR